MARSNEAEDGEAMAVILLRAGTLCRICGSSVRPKSPSLDFGQWSAYGRRLSKSRMGQRMRGLPSRFSDWVVAHPVWWGVGSGVLLVVLGVAFDLAPIVVIAAGTAIGVLNILHARRRGYCPLPVEPGSHPMQAEAE